MEWSKFYANLPDDIRVQAAEDAAPGAAWVLMQAIAYCTRAESQGRIRRSQAHRLYAPPSTHIDLCVKALVSEHVFIPEPGVYLLDPDLWNEERNMSDAAEIKKERDREYRRRKRAEEKERAASADMSNDASADSRGDSRATGRPIVAPQSRGEKNYPPNPPQSGGNMSRCTKHQRPRRGCADCALPPLAPVPPWCGKCREETRRVEHPDTGVDCGACPNCHPSVVRTA